MDKILKRFASMLLVLCMVVSSAVMLYSEPAYAASKKASISKKKITLTYSKTCKLKIRNAKHKVKWSTTNKKIAKIKKKRGKKSQIAVIKAGKKTGTCYIKAKVGKKTYKCKVTVKKAKAKPKTNPPGGGSDPEDDFIKPDNEPEREIEIRDMSGSSKDLTAGFTASAPGSAEPGAAFVDGFAGFSLGLLKNVIAADRSEEKNSNVLISPDSVAAALAMTENGAAGNTLAEMKDVLAPGISPDEYNLYLSTLNRRLSGSDKYIFSTANSIWARENMVDVKEDFLRANKNYHDAEFYVAPFNEDTVKDMNSWVFNKSRNMIDNIISDLSDDSRMVLINTVAFEGKWEKPFEESNKTTAPFTSYDGTKKNVSMLRDSDDYQYFELKGGKGFAKYYRGASQKNGVAFVGILPPEGMSADAYIESLSGSDFISGWSSRKYKRVRLTLPEFSNDYSCSMGQILKSMGMTTAFSEAADFSRMADPTPESPSLNISDVLHKTHIELDENGTKAAAATAVIIEKSSSMPGESPIELNFNRPFVYALVDTGTGVPLFIGEIVSMK